MSERVEARGVTNFALEQRRVWLRFGRVPPGERSKTYLKDPNLPTHEEGVSCYRAYEVGGLYVVDLHEIHWLARKWFTLYRLDRAAYICEGREIGRGFCGEPLIRDVQVIRSVGKLQDFIACNTPIRSMRDLSAAIEAQKPQPQIAVPRKPSLFEQKTREVMDKGGLLEAYDEMQAQQKKEAEVKQSPWTMQHVQASRERWKEDLWT